ncbi:MAG: capsular biosynthesis protein [Cellvibrionaceae bacterium]|nr:capsular biosynthesis protein [Cellvibrionaceae bacterium]
MIDIHCHLLPGIDDGPDTMEAALAMARLAVANGITHAVLTPHIHPGRWDNSASLIKDAALDFKQMLLTCDIPLQIGVAAEVRVGTEIMHQINGRQIPFLGHWGERRVMLLEMPHSHVPMGIERLVNWLLERNILPMIAHPERNKDVHRNPGKLSPLIGMGCLIQLTASSISGQWGQRSQQCAHELLAQGVVTVIASDAHNIKHRPPNLNPGRDAAAEIVGEDEAYRLVLDNPWRIVGHQFMP